MKVTKREIWDIHQKSNLPVSAEDMKLLSDAFGIEAIGIQDDKGQYVYGEFQKPREMRVIINRGRNGYM